MTAPRSAMLLLALAVAALWPRPAAAEGQKLVVVVAIEFLDTTSFKTSVLYIEFRYGNTRSSVNSKP